MVDLIVIGAGPGGYEAAIHAGKLKKKVLLVEREYIGGTCLNVGCIPTKTLLKSSHVLAQCRHSTPFGVTTGEATFSMPKVQERKTKVVTTLVNGIEASLKKAGVEVLRGQAKILAPGKVEVEGKTFEATNILIATGSRPAKPPIPGLDSPSVIDSTGALALTEVPATLSIIGGGVIGLEFACFFADIGSKVTVVEMLPTIAPIIDIDISKRLLSALKRKGIVFHLSAKVQKVEGKTLHFTDDKGQPQSVTGDLILNATGRRPNTDGFGAEAIGLDIGRTGVVTDDRGRTNLPGVWACGDVTGRSMLAHSATREGLVAVENMFGGNKRMRYIAIPSVVYTDPEVASCGKTEEELVKAAIPFRKAVVPMGVAGRFLIETEGEAGTLKILVGEKNSEVLGIHIIGGPCSELIFGASMMIENEMRGSDLFDIVFPHPTISEALKEAVLQTQHP